MANYQHVLLAADLLGHSNRANERAVNLAQLNGAKLSIIHVVELMSAYSYGYYRIADIEKDLMDHAEEELNKVANALGIPEANRHLKKGPAKAEILLFAKENDVDCIVVGSHARRGLSKLLGSTATAVINQAKCDVVTVRCE